MVPLRFPRTLQCLGLGLSLGLGLCLSGSGCAGDEEAAGAPKKGDQDDTDDDDSTDDGSGDSGTQDGGEPATYAVAGHVQKGPFVNGSALSISELDPHLVPTGRVFNTTVLDDTGAFDLHGVELHHRYARVTADGYYFDENRGETSGGRLELHAIADLSDVDTVNVNLLSHLERPRVEYLLSSEEMEYADAKAQAQREVFDVFMIDVEDAPNSEQLDIARGDDADAALLAVCVLMQGYRSTGDLTELLSAIGTDLRTDGLMDSETSGSALMNAATLVDLGAVRESLETRYESFGVEAEIGDFETLVTNFRDKAPYTFTEYPDYPDDAPVGENLLTHEVTSYAIGEHSLNADLSFGTSVRVEIEAIDQSVWWYSDPGDWVVGNFDFDTGIQSFVALPREGAAQMTLWFEQPGSARVLYYENDSEYATHEKTIEWSCDEPGCDCGDEEEFCDGMCVATKEDPLNCGGCGKECQQDEVCTDFVCVPQ